jgi:hypothetical protein
MSFRFPSVITRAALCVGAVTALAIAGAAVAVADPPDYSGYQPVDPKPFQTYSTYGGAGVQFSTPSGLLCRIVVISRGMFTYAMCLGSLAGVGAASEAFVNTAGAAGFTSASRSDFLTAQHADDTGVHTGPIPDAGFSLLAAGSSITYTDSVWSGTCAVDADTTRCTVSTTNSQGQPTTTKSFVLGPTNSTIE